MQSFHFNAPVEVTLNGAPVVATLIATDLNVAELKAAKALSVSVQSFKAPKDFFLDAVSYTHACRVSNLVVIEDPEIAAKLHDACDDLIIDAGTHAGGPHTLVADGLEARRFSNLTAAATAAQKLWRRGIPSRVL
jgi:hypothetical protein